MRWEKGDLYIEISREHSVERGDVFTVMSNISDGRPPPEWREPIPHSDKPRLAELIETVKRYAKTNQFKAVRPSH